MKKILALVAILAIGLGSVNAQENLRWRHSRYEQ